jgi:predicted transcriptional regulator
MKKSLLIFALALFCGLGISAQDCVSYYATEVGTRVETQSFDAKNKMTGVTVQKVTDKQENDGQIVISIESQSFDSKNKPTGTSTLEYFCKNGVFYMDMKKFMDPTANQSYEGMEVVIDATDMEMPAVLAPGQTLKDASFSMKVSNQGFPVINMSVKITNRKVEAVEKITTTAGTFECYKISYDLEMMNFVKITTKAIEWYAPNTGAVRSETYDSKGNLLGYSIITKFSK